MPENVTLTLDQDTATWLRELLEPIKRNAEGRASKSKTQSARDAARYALHMSRTVLAQIPDGAELFEEEEE